MKNIHGRGKIYLSGGIEHSPKDDLFDQSWRVECANRLRNIDYFPLDASVMHYSFAISHGETTEYTHSELSNLKSSIRTNFIESDLKIITDDADAIILFYNESVRRDARSISEVQIAYDCGLPVFVVSAWENWETEVPSWLLGLSTKVFTTFSSLYNYLSELPDGVLQDEHDDCYLCTLSGDVVDNNNGINFDDSQNIVDQEIISRYNHFKKLIDQQEFPDQLVSLLAIKLNKSHAEIRAWLNSIYDALQVGHVSKEASFNATVKFANSYFK